MSPRRARQSPQADGLAAGQRLHMPKRVHDPGVAAADQDDVALTRSACDIAARRFTSATFSPKALATRVP